MSLYAGLDAGTQSIKLVVYDAKLRQIVASSSAALALIASDDGTREQLASWWIEALQKCFAAIDPAIRSRVVAMAVSGQQHGFVALGAQGEVLAPVKLWCDTTSYLECEEIMAAVGGAQRCIALVGNPILAGYTASKIRWTAKHRPEAYCALKTILLPHDYLNFYLTGSCFCEFGDASGSGWLDVRNRQYSSELLKAIDPSRDLLACLPPLVPLATTYPILAHIAKSLGVSKALRIAVGGGDNMMAAIGTGCVEPGKLAMSLGTSGTLFAHAEHPVIDPNGSWAAFCSSSGGWLPLICTMNCTIATEVTARMFGFSVLDGDALIAASSPGANGLTLLPFFNGERTPNLPNARGALMGMDLKNATAANLHRAAMEGATYSLRNGFEGFVASKMAFNAIIMTGGGSQSASWRQMVSDVFDLPVQVPMQSEGAAFGAVLQSLWAYELSQGSTQSLAEIVRQHVSMNHHLSVQPNPVQVAAYKKPYLRFLENLQALHRQSACLAPQLHQNSDAKGVTVHV
jgi:xylulokinase